MSKTVLNLGSTVVKMLSLSLPDLHSNEKIDNRLLSK